MAAKFLATSTNVVVHEPTATTAYNTQNARIHYDASGALGWLVATDGTLSDGTELRRSVLDSADKTTAKDALNSDVGVEFAYVAVQKRSVKTLKGLSAARVVFAPAHL